MNLKKSDSKKIDIVNNGIQSIHDTKKTQRGNLFIAA